MALLIICGPSGAGKDYLVAQMRARHSFHEVVPVTTRTPRSDEIPDVHYRFVEVPVFQSMIASNALFEWDYALGSYYGYTSEVETLSETSHVALHMLSRMALRVKSRLAHRCLLVFLSLDEEGLRAQLERRACPKTELLARLQLHHEELTHSKLFDIVVPNGTEKSDGSLASTLYDRVLQLQSGG